MKKKFIAALVAFSCMPIIPSATVSAATDAVFDDFESYTVTESGSEFTGKGTVINENWCTSSVNAGYNDGMKVSIAQDSADATKKVLGIRGAGGNNIAAVNYTGDRSEIIGDAVMEADITLVSWNGTAGVRFMVSEDEKSYYQLLIAEGKDTLLQKYVNGTQQGESVVVHSGWGQARTSHVKMEMKDSKLTCYYTLLGIEHTGVIEDSAPLTAQGNATTCSFIMKSDTTSYFDNFSYKKYDSYVDGAAEPSNVFYRNAAYGVSGNNGEYVLDESCRVRKVQLYNDEPSALADTEIFVKNEDETISIGTIAAENITSYGAEILNTVTKDAYSSVIVDYAGELTELKVFTDIDNGEEYTLTPGSLPYLAEFAARFKTGTAEWSCSDDTILSVENGTLIPHAKGTVDVSVTNGTITYTITITVRGEMEVAIEEGKINEYLLSKQSIVNAVNTAIGNKNAAEIASAITGMSGIFDFNYMRVKELSPEQLTKLAERMAEYEPFCAADTSYTLDNLNALMNTIYLEIKVGEMCNKTVQELEQAITDNNADYYKFDLTKPAWVSYKSALCDILANKEFKSYTDLVKSFNDASVLAMLANTISADLVGDTLTNYAEEIGYDVTHYNSITNKTALNEAILTNKSSLTTAEAVKAFVDAFVDPVKPTSTPKPTTGGGGIVGSSGRATSSNISIPAVSSKPQEPIDDEKKNTYLYNDLSDTHWAYDAVSVLSILGVIKGYEDGSFMPDKVVTRGEFVKMLAEMFKLKSNVNEENGEEAQKFPDVDKNAWYYESVIKAVDNGIVNGDEYGNFNPDNGISREEMVSMILRVIENCDVDVRETKSAPLFNDSDNISEWAYRAVVKLGIYGVISGDENGDFRPKDNVTRAEAAQALSMLMQ